MNIGIYDLETGKLEHIILEGYSLEGYNLDGKGTVQLPVEFNEDEYDFSFGVATLSEEKARNRLRVIRDELLKACDFPPIVERPENEQQAWKDYRQAVRQLPKTIEDPFNPVWPTPPKFE